MDEMGKRKKEGCREIEVKVLPSAKIGQPLLIGEKYDREVQEYIVALREVGIPVYILGVRSPGTVVLERKDSGMLALAGGSVVLTKDWARYLLQRMGMLNGGYN